MRHHLHIKIPIPVLPRISVGVAGRIKVRISLLVNGIDPVDPIDILLLVVADDVVPVRRDSILQAHIARKLGRGKVLFNREPCRIRNESFMFDSQRVVVPASCVPSPVFFLDHLCDIAGGSVAGIVLKAVDAVMGARLSGGLLKIGDYAKVVPFHVMNNDKVIRMSSRRVPVSGVGRNKSCVGVVRLSGGLSKFRESRLRIRPGFFHRLMQRCEIDLARGHLDAKVVVPLCDSFENLKRMLLRKLLLWNPAIGGDRVLPAFKRLALRAGGNRQPVVEGSEIGGGSPDIRDRIRLQVFRRCSYQRRRGIQTVSEPTVAAQSHHAVFTRQSHAAGRIARPPLELFPPRLCERDPSENIGGNTELSAG